MRGRGKIFYKRCTIPKKDVAATQQSAALFPTRFNECALHGTDSESELISFMQAYTPLYTPDMFDALS